MDKLFQEMIDKGLISLVRISGDKKLVLEFLILLNIIEPCCPSIGYCKVIGKCYASWGGITHIAKQEDK